MKRLQWFGWCVLVAAVVPLVAQAATPASKPVDKESATAVGLFEAMEAGQIEVAVIPKDAVEGMITVKNKSGKPLTIKLPDAFAGVPVLAQGLAGLGDPGGGGNNNSNSGNSNQGFGGGMGGGMMGGGMGGGMMGGGMFNIGPEKLMKGKITLVCLDHGKKDPNPRVPYKLIPIESYAKSADVVEVVKMLARGELDQRSAQAATWHLQNGLSWEELAKKIGAKHLNGSVEPFFTVGNLQRALAASRMAKERAEKATQEKSLAASSTSEGLAKPR